MSTRRAGGAARKIRDGLRKLRRLPQLPLSRVLNELVEVAGRYGTSGYVELGELGLSEDNRLHYAPSDWFALRRTMNRLRVDRSDVFIDYGAGKGRVVLAAARRPFARVIGVELAPALVEDARQNVSRLSRRVKAREVVVEVADATEYEVPDDLTVAYFFCPFTGPVFRTVIERLFESVDRHPREMLIVYGIPFEHNYLISTGRAKPIATWPSRWPSRGVGPGEAYVCYAVRPANGEFPATESLISRPRVHDARWLSYTDPQVKLGERFHGEALVPPPRA